MINELEITNFKSHKNTNLKFDKGVNAIIGNSDSGKTNTIRAIRWVLLNATGGRIRSDWGGDTKVKVFIEKENIERRKIKNGQGENNQYYFSANKTIKPDTSFGRGTVPDDIKRFLNITDINFQYPQQASPFLLNSSAGEVARYLNKIVRLDKIDTANANINSTLRKEKQDLQYEKERLIELDGKLKDYVWLEQAEGCLVKLEQFETSLIGKKLDRQELIQLRDSIAETEEAIEEIDEIVQYEDEVNRLIELNEKIGKKKERFDELTTLYNDIVDTEENISNLNTKIDTWQEEFDELMPQVCPLCGRGGKSENYKHR